MTRIDALEKVAEMANVFFENSHGRFSGEMASMKAYHDSKLAFKESLEALSHLPKPSASPVERPERPILWRCVNSGHEEDGMVEADQEDASQMYVEAEDYETLADYATSLESQASEDFAAGLEALKKYGVHGQMCSNLHGLLKSIPRVCRCGLDEALASFRKTKGF